MLNSTLRALALLVALVIPTGLVADSTQAAQAVLSRSGDAIVSIEFVMDIAVQGQEQSQDGGCLGTLVDPSGIVLVSNASVNPPVQAGVSVKPRDFKVTVAGQSYEAKLIYKDSEKDYAFLRLGIPEDPDHTRPAAFPSVTVAPRVLKLGEGLVAVGRFGEREDFAPLVFNLYVTSVVSTPKTFYIPSGVLPLVRGTPAFAPDGTAVGLLVQETQTTVTGKAQATQRLIIKPIDDLAAVIKGLPSGDGDDEEGDEMESDPEAMPEPLEEEEEDALPGDDE